MVVDNYLIRLKNIVDSEEGWFSIAVCFLQMKESAAQNNEPLDIPEISKITGYNLNTLNRFVVVAKFLNSIKNQIEIPAHINLNQLSYPSLEVVNRICKVDKEVGLKILSEVISEEPLSYRKVREHYKQVIDRHRELVSPHQNAAIEANSFKNHVLEALKHSPNILGEGDVSLRISFRDTNQGFVDAVSYIKSSDGIEAPEASFDIKFFRETPEIKSNLEHLIYRSFFVSYFYKNHWVIFPTTTGLKRIMTFCEIIDILNFNSVGVAVYDWENKGKNSKGLSIYKEPSEKNSGLTKKKIDDFLDLKNNMLR